MMFEGAKFGDRYQCRNGMQAVFVSNCYGEVTLLINDDDTKEDWLCNYDLDGRADCDEEYDIVKRIGLVEAEGPTLMDAVINMHEAIVQGRYISDEQEAFRRHYDEPDQYGHLCTIRCNVDLNDPTRVSIHSKEKAIEVIDRNPKFEKKEGIIKN